MTTRRSFLKLLATALSSLLPLHLLPKAKPSGVAIGSRQDAHLFDGICDSMNVYTADLEDIKWINFTEDAEDIEMEDDCPFPDELLIMDIPLDRRYWIDGTPVES